MDHELELDAGRMLWLLAAACQLHRVPFDPKLARQQFPPPHTLAGLRLALAEYGLDSALADCPPEALTSVPAPAFLLRREPSGALSFALLLKAPERPSDDVQLLEAGAAQPVRLTPAEFAAGHAGVLQVARRAEPPADTGGAVADGHPAAARPRRGFGFGWFVPELLKHQRIWREILLASFAIQLVGLATPLFTQVIIDKVVVHQTHGTLVVLAVALLMFMAFSVVMSWLRQYLVLHTGNRIDAVLGAEVFRHLLRLPLPWFEQRPTGTLVARLAGVETIRGFVSGAAVTLILDLPFLLIFLAVMFWYSWQLSLIAIGLLGAICLISALVTPLFRERVNRQFLLGARNQSFLTEYVSGIATVKALQLEPQLESRYGDYLAQYLAAGFSTRQLGNGYQTAANGLEQLMTLSILVVGALLVMNNDGFTVGMLVAFQMFASRMSQPMLRLTGLWQEFQQARIAVARLGDILDIPQEPHSLIPAREGTARGQGRIELAGVSFRYSEHHTWLYRHLDLAFRPGRLTVLMGPSGCGKSTLAKLLLGFHMPQEGQVTLDGRDIRHLAANELRAAFGVVPQETVLFAGTLYDNLLMAQPHASFEEVIAACKAAEIHDFIDALPQGYQTEIGERGIGLSGGQRQRIAIARALLKRPRILIFDEAASNLDAHTAEHFARTINGLKGQATMIFITHQIPKGLQVDEVVALGEHGARMGVVGDGRGNNAGVSERGDA